jgi:hypothetical protein
MKLLDRIKIPCDCQKAVMTGLGSTRPPDEFIDAVVSMIEIDQDEWVEEVLDNVGMLNILFNFYFCRQVQMTRYLGTCLVFKKWSTNQYSQFLS